MVEKSIMPNVIDFALYCQGREVGKAIAISVRVCRYCGAELAEGEREDECSSNVGPRVSSAD